MKPIEYSTICLNFNMFLDQSLTEACFDDDDGDVDDDDLQDESADGDDNDNMPDEKPFLLKRPTGRPPIAKRDRLLDRNDE